MTASPVPTAAGDGEPTVVEVGQAVSEVGLLPLLRDSLVRFREGDGFSHSRALALQLALSIVPLVIAAVGLSGALHAESIGDVLRHTVLSLTPGAEDDLLRLAVQDALVQQEGEDRATTALVLGLLTAVVALTTAMGQVERGANRLYGIGQDRPTLRKYARALVLALVAGLPMLTGLTLIVAGSAAADAMQDVYGIDRRLLSVLRWPTGLALSLGAIILLMRHAPHRRRPPGWSWLAPAAATSLLLWLLFTGLLALYVTRSGAISAVYGQLTSVMALLVWAYLTSMALLLGLAMTAELEAAGGPAR